MTLGLKDLDGGRDAAMATDGVTMSKRDEVSTGAVLSGGPGRGYGQRK